MDKQTKLIDADKVQSWIDIEFEKKFPGDCYGYADGRQSILDKLESKINDGSFNPDPIPLPTLTDANKLCDVIDEEIKRQNKAAERVGVGHVYWEFHEGSATTLEWLKKEIESGKFSLDPVPLSTIKQQIKIIDQTTTGTDDEDEVGEVVQRLLDKHPDYNKVYVARLMPYDWEIVGRLEVISHD
ncbi:hypothetical protein ACFQ3W_24825 [Paenibacillus puldeungensis]|uniref:Uncharacterized protein n=1 Tax=Paenibacillus puldeungensis TaxID=696536 RepID=A0ABW3S466_9BACL